MTKNSRKLFVFSFIFFLSFACNNTPENITTKFQNENIPVYNYEQLTPLLHTESNKIYLVNFWAMWCAPCIEELPYLQEYTIKNPDIELILVSMDFPEDIETKLKPFIAKKNITAKVV